MTREQSPAELQKSSLPVVIIIGGGFGGLSAARGLAGAAVQVVVIDRTNHHVFQPLLYQVATAGLSPADIAKPIRSILRRQENARVVLGEVIGIDLAAREVRLTDGSLRYDYLIVATGARHAYFGNDSWEEFAPGLKNLADAVDIRRRILTAFEHAENESDPGKRRALMTFVVVGAGPTGVEMAGAIAELAHVTLARDFRRIDPAQTRVLLVEAGPRVLPAYDPSLSASGLRQLERMRVEVRLATPVRAIDGETVQIGEEVLPAATVVWAAGNQASPLARQLGIECDRAGRAVVNQDLTIAGHPEVQAIGDMVAIKDARGQLVPGVAPAALQQGTHAARNVRRQLDGQPPADFWYFDKGSLATIGRHAGIADLRGLRFSGAPAWFAWVFIHLIFLIGFRNRVFVFFNWVWAYITYGQGARLITESRPAVPGAATRPSSET